MAYRKKYYKKKQPKKNPHMAYKETPPKDLHVGKTYKQIYGNSKGTFVELLEDGSTVTLITATGMKYKVARKSFEEFYDEMD